MTKVHAAHGRRSDWLLDSDPAIRWQVMQDLTGAPVAEVAAERARVATEGMGARLVALQAADGRWGGAAWNRGWDSTMHVLLLLRDMGLDPQGDQARHAIGLVRDRVTWKGCGPPECASNRFFAGEVEPCINGQVCAAGAYFGQDVRGIVDRLLAEQLSDGGWNCEAENGSTRSSFHTTICVLEALLEHELRVGSRSAVTAARLRGQGYLLDRSLFRRDARPAQSSRIGKCRVPCGHVSHTPRGGTTTCCAGSKNSRRACGRHGRRSRGRGDRCGRIQARHRRSIAVSNCCQLSVSPKLRFWAFHATLVDPSLYAQSCIRSRATHRFLTAADTSAAQTPVSPSGLRPCSSPGSTCRRWAARVVTQRASR